MKLIREFDDAIEADIVSHSMRDKGILSVVTSKDSHQLSRAATGAINVALWVMFDEQYDDAIQLLENPDYQPEHVIPFEEMEKIENETGQNHAKRINNFFEKSFTYIFASGLLVLIVYVIIGIMSEA